MRWNHPFMNEPPPPTPGAEASALALGAQPTDPRKSAAAIVTAHDPNLTAKESAEAAVARFCDQAFVSAEAARTGSAALLEAFDDSGLWLASLVQPHQLVAELRQSCCTLTRVIMTQWTRQGETHKLVRLGTALLDSSPPVTTHEAGQIAALLASLLGILRPSRAQDLLEMARPLLKDSVDPHLLREARDWVEIGRVLEALPAEDRFLWNRRLREPEDEWDWETPEARAALRRIVPILTRNAGDADLSRFQKIVPACWWDILRERPEQAPPRMQPNHEIEMTRALPAHGAYAMAPAAPSKYGIYAFGLLTGLACTALFAWLSRTQSAPVTAASAAAPAPTAAVVPIPSVAAPAPSAPAPAVPAFRPPRVSPPPVTESIAKPASSQDIKRQAAVLELAEANPHLQRLHRLVATGTLRENEPLLHGRSALSAADYQTLMRWLMLDPPEHADVRLAVAKVAARVLPPADLVATLNFCIYPSSPNRAESLQCATWAVELNQETLPPQDRQALESLNALAQK
jgi:hypothetical protein